LNAAYVIAYYMAFVRLHFYVNIGYLLV